MSWILFLLICAAFFAVQLFLCFRCKKNIIKIIPFLLILGFIAGCCIAASPGPGRVSEDWRSAALVMMVIGLYALAADGLAWLTYGVVKLVQNRRK